MKAGNIFDYNFVRFEGISFAVKLGAANNVKHHLSKLLKQGRVVQIGGGDLWQATTTTTSGGNRL